MDNLFGKKISSKLNELRDWLFQTTCNVTASTEANLQYFACMPVASFLV